MQRRTFGSAGINDQDRKRDDMSESANEILLGHVKAIREKFGDKFADDPKALTVLLTAEAPELHDKIDAFVALLTGAPAAPAAPIQKAASPEVDPAAPEAAHVTPEVGHAAPEHIAPPASPIDPPPPTTSGQPKHGRLMLIGGVLTAVVLIGAIYVYNQATRPSTGPSITITRSDAPEPPSVARTRHAGEKLVDNFDGAPQDMFSGRLLIGKDGAYFGEVGQNEYRLIGTDATRVFVRWAHLTDTVTHEPVPVASIEADVFVDATAPNSAVGLVFNHSDTTAYLFSITKNGTATIASVEYSAGKGYSFGNQQSLGGSAKNGWNRLTVRQQGSGTEFLVNGKAVASQSDSSIQGIDAGMVAIGAGTFHFRNVVRILG
jgi:hypothetical protein